MELTIKTTKKNELIDITQKAKDFVKNTKEGVLLIYAKHTTAAVTINENEDPNIKDDILKGINTAILENNNYKHDKIDNNAAAHIKATLVGPSELIPIENNKLQLGTYQDIFFVEFDGPRTRTVIFKILS